MADDVDYYDVCELIRKLDSGMTEPVLCNLSDDNLYAVKGRNALTYGLLAEAYAARLAQLIKLPVPNWSIANVDEGIISASGTTYRSLGAGPAFASLWRDTAQPLAPSMINDANRDVLAKLYVFDHWIGNSDRTLTEHGGNPNVFVDLSGNNLFIIDHNLAFSRTHVANELELHAGRASWKMKRTEIVFVEELRAALLEARMTIKEFDANLPWQWVDEEPNFDSNVQSFLARAERDSFWDELI